MTRSSNRESPESQTCAQCGLPYGKGGVLSGVEGSTLHFCCYGCSFTHSLTGEQGEAGTAGLFLARLGFSAFLSMNIMAISWMIYDQGWTTFGLEPETIPYLEKLLFVLSIPIMLFVGWPYVRNGWNELQSFRFSMDGLIALGTFTAFGFSSVQTFTGGGAVYFDTATMTLVLVTAGRYIEATAKVRTSDAIRKLIDLQPDTSRVIRSGREILMPSSDVAVGESIKVLPGERVPLDGVLEGGMTTVNESILNGESIPVVKRGGDSVFAATINIDGAIIIKVMAGQAESVHSRIVQLMDEAQRSRSPIQQTVDKIAGTFIPVVIGIALLTLVGWLLIGPFELALIHALTVLVVACPCALGIGAPLANAIGIGHAAERGVLVRSTAVLERTAATRGVAFDKTGTLTKGELSVRSVHAPGNENEMVRIAASLERDSEHVLGRGIVQHAREGNLTLFESRTVRAVPGLGLSGSVLVDGTWTSVFVGTGELMEREALKAEDPLLVTEPTDATRVYVGWGGSVQGSLELIDTLRQKAKEVIDELREMNIQTWMLSGDSESVTRKIAGAVGIAEAFGRLLPADKLETIRRLRGSGVLMMVGDGINDAPSLAAADVGVTLGSATDIAKESADVTIIGDHLEKIPWLIRFSRRVLSTIRWNLVWAFGYNAVGIAFAVAGLLEPVLAAIAMVLSSLFIIVNSRRLVRQ